jgi:hypothetical protein
VITGAAVLGFAKGAWGFLRAIPWQVYAIAALLALGWWWGERRHSEGVAETNQAWTDAQRAEDLRVAVDRAVRAAFASAINAKWQDSGHAAQLETRETTDAALRRIEHAIAEIELPPGCPSGLPASVRAEGRAAVERARAAGDPLRAERNP